jgi:aspartokinase-like uncharacterized kinase
LNPPSHAASLVVLKVGGSLFDHPALGPGLNLYLDPVVRTDRVWVLPGGGGVAGVARQLDAIHRLGPEVSHWLALRGMTVTARFLRALLPGSETTAATPSLRGRGVAVLDGYQFARDDDGKPGSLPHSWDVTSDSLAARAAAVGGAKRLVLLKSVDVPAGTSWPEAAARGWVDGYFPKVGAGLTVEVVNFRRWLDERFPKVL